MIIFLAFVDWMLSVWPTMGPAMLALWGALSHIHEWKMGGWKRKKTIAFPACLPRAQTLSLSFTEWGLLSPSSTPAHYTLGSLGSQVLRSHCLPGDRGFQFRSVGLQGTSSCPKVQEHHGFGGGIKKVCVTDHSVLETLAEEVGENSAQHMCNQIS